MPAVALGDDAVVGLHLVETVHLEVVPIGLRLDRNEARQQEYQEYVLAFHCLEWQNADADSGGDDV